MYNSKDLVVDEDLTFLSYNQTINAEFTLEEILDSPLWSINSDNGLIKAIPLFNCDKITSSNSSDKVLDSNKCVILENDMDTIVKCISDDTGSMHYHSVELYAYAPYTKLDVISEVTVYCILHDKYLNTVGNVNVDVYIDDELSGSVLSDSNGVCRFKVEQPCTVRFVYGELESNIVVIDEPQIYTLSIETDKSSLFTDESVTVTGVLTVDGEVYADQSIALYDGLSLIDTVVTDSNGEYTKTVSGLSVGAHVFRAVHAHVRSGTVSVSVNAHSYSLSIASDKQSILTTESVTISGVLLKDSGAFSGQSVALYDGSSLVDTLSTDSNGAYEKTLTGLSVGVHTFKAVNSNAESSTISITVNEPTHTYSLSIASDKQSILTTESVTISGTLLMDSSPYTGQSVALYDGSSLVDTLTTDSSGNYSKTVSGLSVGTHTFKAVNTNAESTTVSVTVSEPTPVHDYSLTVTGDSIIQTGDNDNITATLKDNGVVVSGETLNYQIKHGSTVIDSGTDTTDSNGQITITYTGTGIGDVDVIVRYGSLLQETYALEDCWKYGIQSTDTWHNIQSPNTGTVSDGEFTGYNKILDFDWDITSDWQLECDFKQSAYRVGLIICDESNTTSYDTSRYAVLLDEQVTGHYGIFFEGKNASKTLVINQKDTQAKSFNTYYHIKIVKQGNTISAYCDDTLIGSGTEMGVITTANVGVYTWNSKNGYMKNLKIKAL